MTKTQTSTTSPDQATSQLPTKVETLDDLHTLQRITTSMCQAYELRRKERGAVEEPVQKTVDAYRKDFKLLINRGKVSGLGIWAEAAKTEKINTWKLRRAAISYCLYKLIRGLKSRIDHDLRRLPPEARTPTAVSSDVKNLLGAAIMWQQMPENKAPLEKVSPRRSKRHVLRGLPPDWELQIARRMAKCNSAYVLPLLAVAATGMRPEEMASGIEVTLTRAGEEPQIMIKIRGAKRRSNAGQDWREHTLDVLTDPKWRAFFDAWTKANQPTRIQLPPTKASKDHPYGKPLGSKEAFARSVAYHASKLWPSKIDNSFKAVTPYAIRHAKSDDLRAAGHTPIEIAEALGHCTTTSQGHYGLQDGRGRGAVALSKTRAARGVAETRTPMAVLDGLPKNKTAKAKKKLGR